MRQGDVRMNKTCYILGTSNDLTRLERGWDVGKDIIGINSIYRFAQKMKFHLDHWLCYDQCFTFFDWLNSNEMPMTNKWIFNDYKMDDRLNRFVPPPKYHLKTYVNPFKQFENHLVHFYMVKPIGIEFSPYVQMDRTEANETGLSCLEADQFTLFCAISLAIGLGYKDIKLRGFGFSGSHFDEKDHAHLDHIYDTQIVILKKKVIPALVRQGIEFHNETLQSEFTF